MHICKGKHNMIRKRRVFAFNVLVLSLRAACFCFKSKKQATHTRKTVCSKMFTYKPLIIKAKSSPPLHCVLVEGFFVQNEKKKARCRQQFILLLKRGGIRYKQSI